jgi:hypothetical protein
MVPMKWDIRYAVHIDNVMMRIAAMSVPVVLDTIGDNLQVFQDMQGIDDFRFRSLVDDGISVVVETYWV